MGIFDWLTGNNAADPGVPRRGVADLREALLAANDPERPWGVRHGGPGEAELIAEWKIVDAKWLELFGKAGLRKTFRVLMRLDDAASTVRSVDEDIAIEWHSGVPVLSFQASGFRGQERAISGGFSFGVTETGELGTGYSYKFSTSEIKQPLQKIVAASGWAWHGVAFTKL